MLISYTSVYNLYIIIMQMGLIPNNVFDENHITENYLGEMNKLCIYCDAKHFLYEMNNCCHNGKVLFNNEDLYPK